MNRSDSPGSGNKRNVPRQQKDGQPSEDVHHLQQRQRLEVTAGTEQRPERQQHSLCAGEFLCICQRDAFIHVFICVRFHQREALTGVDWSQQQREPELRKSSARQSWVLWGCSAERSAILIQSNKLTSHLKKHREKDLSDRKAFLYFICLPSWEPLESWRLLIL